MLLNVKVNAIALPSDPFFPFLKLWSSGQLKIISYYNIFFMFLGDGDGTKVCCYS